MGLDMYWACIGYVLDMNFDMMDLDMVLTASDNSNETLKSTEYVEFG